jgi:acetate CoA/acetoacetate CoA-transferase alpha subunit
VDIDIMAENIRLPNKVVKINEALARLRSDATILIGGFGERGYPFTLVNEVKKMGIKDLTLVKSDANETGIGIAHLINAGQVKKLICSHCGLNRDLMREEIGGHVEVEIVPQGILAERIRAGGSGIPAFLTDIGINTLLAKGKETVKLNGTAYLLEPAIRGDFALLKAYQADTFGNLTYKQVARNFNPLMAMAADLVIVEAEEIMKQGKIKPDNVVTPGIFVDFIVHVPAMSRAEAIRRGM